MSESNSKKEKGIGILTFHDGINHGAYLQAYALHNYLKNNGYPNVIINYKKFRHWFGEYKCFLYKQNKKALIENIKKIIKFKKIQKKLLQTKFTFSCKKVFLKKFDTVIVGSDEIWNFKNPLLNYNPIYFGKNINAKKIISYATSFGSVNQDEKFPEEMKDNLKKFKAISVRDENSFQIVKNLTNEKISMVLDPVFLYNFSNEIIKCSHNDFILIYAGKLDKECIKEIKNYSNKYNKTIISIGYYNSWADINIVALDPFEWLGYFKKATVIITTMFHGVLFSIKYNKKFSLVLTSHKKNKFEPILTYTGLSNRILKNNKNLEKILNQEINYYKVNQKLNILIKQSEEYLMNSLEK